jgi:hypothetical protein
MSIGDVLQRYAFLWKLQLSRQSPPNEDELFFFDISWTGTATQESSVSSADVVRIDCISGGAEFSVCETSVQKVRLAMHAATVEAARQPPTITGAESA